MNRVFFTCNICTRVATISLEYGNTPIISCQGGGGEIRTHGTVPHTTVFKTVAFNHSATPPCATSITGEVCVS